MSQWIVAKEKIFKYISYSHSRAVKIYFILIRESNLLEQDKFSSFAYCKFEWKNLVNLFTVCD